MLLVYSWGVSCNARDNNATTSSSSSMSSICCHAPSCWCVSCGFKSPADSAQSELDWGKGGPGPRPRTGFRVSKCSPFVSNASEPGLRFTLRFTVAWSLSSARSTLAGDGTSGSIIRTSSRARTGTDRGWRTGRGFAKVRTKCRFRRGQKGRREYDTDRRSSDRPSLVICFDKFFPTMVGHDGEEPTGEERTSNEQNS